MTPSWAPGYVATARRSALMQTGDLLFLPLARSSGGGCERRSCPARPTSTSQRGRRFSRRFPTAMRETCSRRSSRQRSAGQRMSRCLSSRIEEEIRDRPTRDRDVRSPVIERFSYASLAEELGGCLRPRLAPSRRVSSRRLVPGTDRWRSLPERGTELREHLVRDGEHRAG